MGNTKNTTASNSGEFELQWCFHATKKDIVGFMEFCAVCTILSTISTLTAFLLCAVPVINPLALHNTGDWGDAVP